MNELNNEEFEFRDPEWVGRKLKLDKNTVYKFLQEGTIPAVQLGRKWFVSERQLLQWMMEESVRQAQARQNATQAVDRTLRKMTNLSRMSRAVVRNAYAEARQLSSRHLGTEHLLIALSDAVATRAAKALGECAISGEQIRKLLETDQPDTPSSSFRPRRRLHARQAMRIAREIAGSSSSIEPEHLLTGIVKVPASRAVKLLDSLGCDMQRLASLIDEPRKQTSKKGKI